MNKPTRKVLQPSHRHASRKLHSLKELKAKKEHELSRHFQLGFHTSYPKKKRSALACVGLWIGAFFLLLFLTLGTGLVYITSPLGEVHLTNFVEKTINYFGEPMNVRVSISSLGDLWEGRIHIVNLRVYDAYGPWLRISEGTLHPDWVSLLRSIVASWRYTRDKPIPSTFFKHNSPLASLASIQENTHQSNMQNLPFTMEREDPTLDDVLTEPPTQQQPKTTEAASRKHIQLQHPNDAFVHNLLNARDILNNKVVLGLHSGTLISLIMPRLPKYLHQSKQTIIDPKNLFAFLPPWLALDVGELELAHFQLGPDARSINFSTRIHGQLSREKFLLRSTLLAAKEISSQWVLPSISELPEDVKLSLSSMNNFLDNDSRNPKLKHGNLLKTRRVLGYFTLDYDQGDLDLRWQVQDSLILPHLFEGIDVLWTRSRVLAQVAVWPPTAEDPLQARFVSRYGLRLVQDEQIIPTSSSSGQIFWDSKKVILRDISIQSPVKNPNFLLKASLGYSPHEGFGSQFNLTIADIKPIATVFGLDTKKFPVGGGIDIGSYVSRGGDLLFWWRKPLPPIQGHRYLPGYYANPYDGSVLAKSLHRYLTKTLASTKTVAEVLKEKNTKPHEQGQKSISPTQHPAQTDRPRGNLAKTKNSGAMSLASQSPYAKTDLGPLPTPSQGPDGLIYSLKVESPVLQLPKGAIKDVFFSINGTSAHAPSTPEGQSFYDQHKLDAIRSSDLSDFNEDGLPRGVLGKFFLRMGDIFSQGTGLFTGEVFVGGAYEGAKSLQVRLHDMKTSFPGLSGQGQLALAYALPIVKRRWPWIDGDINLRIDTWDFITSLYDSPLRTEGAKFFSTYKSILDDNGKPLQTFKAQINTNRIDSKEFMVRQAVGKAESRHVHSLADTLALSFGSSRKARTRKMHYTPDDSIPIFTADVDLASGRGGPVRWNKGKGNLNITGEKANFTLHMLGELNALLEGLFNFRTRTLSLKEIVLNAQPRNLSIKEEQTPSRKNTVAAP